MQLGYKYYLLSGCSKQFLYILLLSTPLKIERTISSLQLPFKYEKTKTKKVKVIFLPWIIAATVLFTLPLLFPTEISYVPASLSGVPVRNKVVE